jgi:hypothetical protein
MNYQDHGIKFYDNRPLESKRAAAIANSEVWLLNTIHRAIT